MTHPPKVLVVGALSSSLVNFRAPLLEALVARGADVHAAAANLLADKATCAKLRAIRVTPHDIPFQRAGMNPMRDLTALWAAYRVIIQIKPDVVLSYTIKPVIFGMLAARLSRVPQRVAMITGLGFAFSEGRGGTKRILAKKIAHVLYKISLNGAHTVLFQNPDDHRLFEAQGLLPSHAKIGIVNGSGVDLEHFAAAPLPEGPPKFLLVARLLADKGIREYVEAARQIHKDYPKVEFHLAGGADPNPSAIPIREVQGWVREGLIHWHDHVTDVRPLMAQCHVYVLPSYREGTPRTVLEAMAMRRAIITTDVPGCRETTVDGVNGFLVAVRSADAVASAIRRFLTEPMLIDWMASESLNIAQKKYEKNIVAESVVNEMTVLNSIPKEKGD
jgi:glycosyltransferase involved in cell wall biosynthesis